MPASSSRIFREVRWIRPLASAYPGQRNPKYAQTAFNVLGGAAIEPLPSEARQTICTGPSRVWIVMVVERSKTQTIKATQNKLCITVLDLE